MTALVWAAFGVTMGVAVLHATLGLRQPRDPTYLSLAWSMAAVAGFLYFENTLYTATTLTEAVEAVRHREIMSLTITACLLVFLPAYARRPISRRIAVLLWTWLAVLFVANLVTRYGIWYASEPRFVHLLFRGMPYASLITPSFSVLQFAYEAYQLALFVLALSFAVHMLRHGDRRRGVTLVIAAVAVAAWDFIDVMRELLGTSWPFVAEYGFVSWGLIMSVQLALDYRAQAIKLAQAITHVGGQASRLTAILGSMRALEHNIDQPLHVLETGFLQLDGVRDVDPQLVRLRRAVTRLRALSHEMPNLRTRPRKRN